MKIYIAWTLKNDTTLLKKLMVFLEGRGHHITNNTLLVSFLSKKSPDKAERSNEWLFERNVEYIKQADFVIVETTHPDYEAGFIVAYAAAREKKKCLLLSAEGVRVAGSPMLQGCTFAHCYQKSYTDWQSLRDTLTLFTL